MCLPDNLKVREALERVLRLPSVASKRYLTNKVNCSFYHKKSENREPKILTVIVIKMKEFGFKMQ